MFTNYATTMGHPVSFIVIMIEYLLPLFIKLDFIHFSRIVEKFLISYGGSKKQRSNLFLLFIGFIALVLIILGTRPNWKKTNQKILILTT